MSQTDAAASLPRLPTLHESRKAIFAAAIGNVLEWYDFGVYVFFASVIARNFFPPGDPAAALLSSFAVFGVGFLMRPLGGIIIGRFGDTRGRKAALMLTIMTMAFGTVMVGVLPGYASIGVAAPVLLVVARLIQGFSAGGEWGGSTAFMVEWSPHGRRGWYSSFQQASIALSLVLGSGTGALLTSIMSAETLNAWGWRIPFLFGIVLALVGAWLRRNIDETPAYRAAMQDKIQPAGSGFVLALRAFGFTIHWTVAFYILLSYMPTFTRLHAGVSPSQSLWSNTIGVLVLDGPDPCVRRIVRSRRAPAIAAGVLRVFRDPHSAAVPGDTRPARVRCAGGHSGVVRRRDCTLLRRRTCSDCRDVSHDRPFHLDDPRLCTVRRHLRRLRAVHRNLADQHDRFAAVTSVLRNRRSSGELHRKLEDAGDSTPRTGLIQRSGQSLI